MATKRLHRTRERSVLGRVPVVQHQRVPVRIPEERHVAYAAVHRLGAELDARGLELRAGGGDVADVQRDRVRGGVELEVELVDREQLQREAAGFELGPALAAVTRGALQAEHISVEL